MKFKKIFIALSGLALAFGVGFGLGVKQEVREVSAIATGDCLIKGTVNSLGMSNDWTGQSIGTWNGSNQFEVINLSLKTTDSFKFNVQTEWGKWFGKDEIHAEYGNPGLWNSDGDGNLSPKENGFYNFYIQSGNMYTSKTNCMIKGTVASQSMSGDWDGKAIGTAETNQFVISNLQLSTTDEFGFSVAGWFTDNSNFGGRTKLGNDESRALFNDSGSNLVPLADGYYNFYIQSNAIYVTQSEYDPLIADGYYLRGNVLGWTGAPLALTGSGPYTVTRDFVAEEKIQMVHYEGGLPSYVPAVSVTPGDATYFNVVKSGDDAQVEKAGRYIVSITAAGAYTLTDTASNWCRDFLDSMTCTNSGLVAPVFNDGYSWTALAASYSTSYGALDDIAKNAIFGATANPSGTVIQEAASRYDTIVINHGYIKFITSSTDVLRSTVHVTPIGIGLNQSSSNTALIIVVATASVALLALAGYFMIRRRKED